MNVWVIGEEITYFNWSKGEPNSDTEHLIHIYNANNTADTWNNTYEFSDGDCKEIYVQANNFIINENDSIAVNVDNIEYTYIDQLMGLYAYLDEDTNDIVLQWSSDENISSVDVYARYGNETDFSKLGSTSNEEYTMSVDTITDKADYKIVVHTRFGEEIQSLNATLIKDTCL